MFQVISPSRKAPALRSMLPWIFLEGKKEEYLRILVTCELATRRARRDKTDMSLSGKYFSIWVYITHSGALPSRSRLNFLNLSLLFPSEVLRYDCQYGKLLY